MAPEKDGNLPRYITGFHAIEEYLRSLRGRPSASAVLYAAGGNKRAAALAALAREADVRVKSTEKTLDGVSTSLVLEIRLDARTSPVRSFEDFLATRKALGGNAAGLVVALDGVTDVHNLGALLRSADLFCADAVVVPGRRTAKDSEVVARISSGASAFVPLFEVSNLVRALGGLKDAGFWVYGADMDGESAAGTKLAGAVVLVLGSEGGGLSRLVRETCDALVRIPTGGHVDSFNVSVAGGILMYEVRRQQGFPF